MDSVFTQLDREWIALIRRPATASELADACALAGGVRPDGLIPAMRRAAPEAADLVMEHCGSRCPAPARATAPTSSTWSRSGSSPRHAARI